MYRFHEMLYTSSPPLHFETSSDRGLVEVDILHAKLQSPANIFLVFCIHILASWDSDRLQQLPFAISFWSAEAAAMRILSCYEADAPQQP